MDTQSTEPIRGSLYIAGAVVALATFFGALGIVDKITPQVIFSGLSVALLQFGAIALGTENARSKAYAPATVAKMEADHEAEVNEFRDAEAVIEAAEKA